MNELPRDSEGLPLFTDETGTRWRVREGNVLRQSRSYRALIFESSGRDVRIYIGPEAHLEMPTLEGIRARFADSEEYGDEDI